MSTPGRSDLLSASPRMFRSNLLDRLSRVHPVVPVIIFAPAIVLMARWGLSDDSLPRVAALIVLGYALWTLLEYWLHRIVFHYEPADGWGARMHWIIHGVHHEHPNDPLRLVMPPAVSVPLGALFFGLFYVTLGTGDAPSLAAGFFAGYLAYDMTHYYVHHGHPRNRLTRTLRERHMRHHFQDDTRGFGVSAPYWDNIFRTAPRSRKAATGAKPEA